MATIHLPISSLSYKMLLHQYEDFKDGRLYLQPRRHRHLVRVLESNSVNASIQDPPILNRMIVLENANRRLGSQMLRNAGKIGLYLHGQHVNQLLYFIRGFEIKVEGMEDGGREIVAGLKVFYKQYNISEDDYSHAAAKRAFNRFFGGNREKQRFFEKKSKTYRKYTPTGVLRIIELSRHSYGINITKIVKMVCGALNIPCQTLLARNRQGTIVKARKYIIALARLYTRHTLVEIGEELGLKKTTVHHHWQLFQSWLNSYPAASREFSFIHQTFCDKFGIHEESTQRLCTNWA